MLLGAIFDRFAAKSPVSVMVQGSLEFALHASKLDAIFDQHALNQYTRTLLFSSAVDLLTQVVCGVHQSVHSAFQACDEPLGVSITSVYNKLQGVEPAVAAELVRHCAERLGVVAEQAGGLLPEWIPGYQVRLLDGNHLASTQHRLKETHLSTSGPLPGLALVVLDPRRMMATDVFPCQDAHAQERSLLDRVLRRAREREVYVADRNFCTRGFLLGLLLRGAFFAIREHGNFSWSGAGKARSRGRIEGARVRQQRVCVEGEGGETYYFRRVVLELDEPTKDGDVEVAVLTNLPEEAADARGVGRLYRRRWTIEGAFQDLACALNSEIDTLCYPKAALFAFCVGLLAYNVLGVVKGALRAEHGQEKVEQISNHYLADEVGGTRRGMMIAIPEGEWGIFRAMRVEEFAEVLRELAKKVRLAAFKKHPRGPKKPAPKRKHDPKKPHVSTARLLAERDRNKHLA
jgi:hypothetical protein